MHYIEDTEDADSAAERFWPERYKTVIRGSIGKLVVAQLVRSKGFVKIYQEVHSATSCDFDEFATRLGNMVVVGAENGADDGFDEVYTAFVNYAPLPESRRYARYFWPKPLNDSIKRDIHKVVVDEYSKEYSYDCMFRDHYTDMYDDFSEFIDAVADVVVAGAENGADDLLGAIYRSFMDRSPLPPARRYPRRLKGW